MTAQNVSRTNIRVSLSNDSHAGVNHLVGEHVGIDTDDVIRVRIDIATHGNVVQSD